MSRPPRPHPPRSTGGSRTDAQDRLDYLPMAYADLLALQRRVAVRALGRGTDQRGDVADTYLQLSALVAHVLAVYQRRYAREAFISTAQAASSLVRHAHRLGAQPDPGLAASGYAVLITKPGVSGLVAAGHPLASVPLGEDEARHYETDGDLPVDAALNALRPVHATRVQTLGAGDTQLRLAGVGHRLRAGDQIAVIAGTWHGLVVDSATEVDDEGGQTVVRVREGPTIPIDAGGSSPAQLLASPAVRTRSFAAAADPVLYPPSAVRRATAAEGSAFPRWWYTVSLAGGGGHQAADVYLAERLPGPIGDDWVLCSTGERLEVVRATAETVATVVLNRSDRVDVTPKVVRVTEGADGFVTTVEDADTPVFATTSAHVSGTVTALRLAHRNGRVPVRNDWPLETEWITGWRRRLELSAAVPNPEPLAQPLLLPGLLDGLEPGREVLFSDADSGAAQVVRLRRVDLDVAGGTTSVEWDPVTPDPDPGWTLDRLVVHGNVAPVSHGRTVGERLTLGDGAAPFPRAPLRQSPLTYLPDASGARPQLEVRVGGLAWARVTDFADSGPDDRHYRISTDAEEITTVVFGDGRTGAVPPAGAAVVATYRVGRGSADLVAGRLSRLKRAHPLLDHVVNLTPIDGGTDPAAPDDVRAQATLPIRTFDRAVSVADLADLALTMPGVARAATRWDQRLGAVLVVAAADGGAPNPLSAVRAFVDARRDTSVPLTLRAPAPHDLAMTVAIEAHPDWLPEAVSASVRAALTARFSFPAERLGQPGFLSEAYALLEGLPGVEQSRVDRFGTAPATGPGAATGVADAVRPPTEAWLRLLPQHLAVTVTGRPR